jgi:broad specificity phosphatase PhoE
MTVLLLARHGETDWNREHRWQGRADPPLNALGREQAAALAASLAGVPLEAIYSSDLARAVETAELVGGALEIAVTAEPALREIDVGEWSGLTTAEIERAFPAGWERHRAGGDGWEHGETHAAMSERVAEAAARIASAHPGLQVLCVAHGGVIRALLARAEGVDLGTYRLSSPGPVNGSVARIAVEDGRFSRID